MSWIDKFKGIGPWPFIEQQNKWGYLNNPRWSNSPKGTADPISASEFCEKSGLPNLKLNRSTHEPCGHWHKTPSSWEYVPNINIGAHYWWQQSIDVYDGTIGFVGMTYEGDGVSDGIVSAIYDVESETWISWGVVRDMYVHYAEPNTCRISSSGYMAYYGSVTDFKNGGYYVGGDSTYSMRLYVFEEGQEPRYTDVWSCNWTTGIPYECWDYAIYDVMDCIGDRIACLAYVQKIDGIIHNKWMVKTSEDAGLTFPTEYSFPALATWAYEGPFAHKLRMTDDGTIWVVHLVNAAAPPYYLQLWKSTDGGVSFTKIWETNYFADNGFRTYSFGWDINDADGQYQTISIRKDPWMDYDYDRVFYVSDDYGATFTTKTFISGSNSMYNTLVANGDYIVVISKDSTPSQHYDFYRSTDKATSFSFVDLEDYVSGISISYFDMQKNMNEIVTANCGDAYYTPPDWPESDFFIGVAYSNDGGATWIVIQSPVPNQDSGSDVFLPGTVIIESSEPNEPQVWPMD